MREREILSCLREGLKNRPVAARLGIAEQTVKNYLQDLGERHGVNNRVQLALLARRLLGSETGDP
jgi:DNA-binding NarL/FixJ family response regulator